MSRPSSAADTGFRRDAAHQTSTGRFCAGAACVRGSRWPARHCSWSRAERSSPSLTRSSITTSPRRASGATRLAPSKRARSRQTRRSYSRSARRRRSRWPDHRRLSSPNANRLSLAEPIFGAGNQRADDLHQLLLFSLVGLAGGTIVAGGLGWLIGRRILSPLQKVTSAARRASQEHLDERIDLDGPHDELRELADTFDDMLNRLDSAFASQRRFVANASHELRTPLTSMRTLIDVAMAKAGEDHRRARDTCRPRARSGRPIGSDHRRAADACSIRPRADSARTRRL